MKHTATPNTSLYDMKKLSSMKNFQTTNIDGATFDCCQYQNNSFLLIIFFRGSWCNYCRKQLAELNKNYKTFKGMKIKIAAISSDSLLNTSLLFNIIKSKFPLLADPDYKIFKLFKLAKPKDKKEVKPAIFLINPKKQIVYSHIGKDYRDRPSVKELIAKFKTLILPSKY